MRACVRACLTLSARRYARPHTLRVALLGSASVPVRHLLNLSARDVSAPAAAGATSASEPFLKWTPLHSHNFRVLLRSYCATLDARLRLSLAAIHEIGPSASARQACSDTSAGVVGSLDVFHAPADANLFAITRDALADVSVDPQTQWGLATRDFPPFFGPCSGEASLTWFASGVGG